MRHNALRELNADLQREVCRDVVVEPQMIPLNEEEIEGAKGDRAAPDVSSRGLWSTFERTFYDVRVLHPNAPSYQSTSLPDLYQNMRMRRRESTSKEYSLLKRAHSPH